MNERILSDGPGEAAEPAWLARLSEPDRATLMHALRRAALVAWGEALPQRKCELVARLDAVLQGNDSARQVLIADSLAEGRGVDESDISNAQRPGAPDRPRLVAPAKLPQRAMSSDEGRAALLHAIAHIEFNAINLALDAAWRYPSMPDAFCLDWLSVAVDEARHFGMIERLLRSRGHGYGDFDAHDGLWEMAERTRGDILDRMALVPRVLEARGLDATPPIQAKLRQVGDTVAADALAVILSEEVRHVALGNRWFGWLCQQRGVEPRACFIEAMRRHRAPKLRAGQINRAARLEAGFSEAELDALLQP